MADIYKVLAITEAVAIVFLVIAYIALKIRSTIAYDILEDDIAEERVVNDGYYRGLLRSKEEEIDRLESQNAELKRALRGSEDKRVELVQRLHERTGA